MNANERKVWRWLSDAPLILLSAKPKLAAALNSAALCAALLLGGCTGLPERIAPVRDFDAERYLGTWYEIARLDHRFERGLEQVTATYGRDAHGRITVDNRGYDTASGQWETVSGTAAPVGDPRVAHLKVQFFFPFGVSYVVFGLDPDYQSAYVTSFNRDVLWFLARTPQVSAEQRQAFIASARAHEFDLSLSLIHI